ncbi:helix-turn-helix domain-containing protein [Corynebacterium poyangense]|uniref:Helix-turn-helix domain-containing protein n=1 Tax=Corynebacterium poyangense TaxID=2684405 RepID=A0A7H0SQC3_9CORY|nr:helix-turn-helix domain-containing protein [Corynebacterium poyangense]QNQ90748.1 helix-turn-helix domain-containing protein [Corynebacterium poyangense]
MDTNVERVDAKELAKRLGVSRNLIYKLANRKKRPLPAYRLGARYTFDPDEVEEWCKKEVSLMKQKIMRVA